MGRLMAMCAVLQILFTWICSMVMCIALFFSIQPFYSKRIKRKLLKYNVLPVYIEMIIQIGMYISLKTAAHQAKASAKKCNLFIHVKKNATFWFHLSQADR